jgi:rhodanese-related sulfurtransferase
MDYEELKKKGGFLLLDVRTRDEFKSDALEGAKLIPVDELRDRLHEVGDLHQPIVVYCKVGLRGEDYVCHYPNKKQGT